jgi:hypothetical protein
VPTVVGGLSVETAYVPRVGCAARSVVGHAMDEHTGEVWQQLLPVDPPGIWGWLESLPQPVKVRPMRRGRPVTGWPVQR